MIIIIDDNAKYRGLPLAIVHVACRPYINIILVANIINEDDHDDEQENHVELKCCML